MSTISPSLILPPHTVSGARSLDQFGCLCAVHGERGLLVHGASLAEAGVVAQLMDQVPAQTRVRCWQHGGGEPTLGQLNELLHVAREQEVDWVAAVGGGSVMDLGKACAGLLHAPLSLETYHDGEGLPVSTTPFIVAPATAGTGSEATYVSVLTNENTGVKKSIRHPSHMARTVVLDAGLLQSCPPAVIASAGMDAFTQAVESYWSRKSTWLTERLSSKSVDLIASNLEAVFHGATGQPAEDLMVGSYLAGVALCNARLGLVHGLAHPLGSRFRAGHGLVCGVCLPHVIAFNRPSVEDKYLQLSQLLGGDLLIHTKGMLERLQIASPFSGKRLDDRDAVIAEALASGSTAANPRGASHEDVSAMLDALLA